MKNNQLLTALMLLGSVQMMFASDAASADVLVQVTNRSNAYAQVFLRFDDKNHNKDNKSKVLAPGAVGTVKIVKGKIARDLTVTYFTGSGGNTKLESATMTVAAPSAWPTSLFIYGDGHTKAGSLVGSSVLESKLGDLEGGETLNDGNLSRFLAYWTGSAETAKSDEDQPLNMYTFSIDGSLETIQF